MKRASPYWWFARVLWPLLGSAWVAWALFRGPYHALDHINRDTLAPLAVWVFFAFFTGVGLLAGAATATVIGGSIEWLLRRIGAGVVAAVCVATLVNVLALWQITDFLQTKYPGLRAERVLKPKRNRMPDTPAPADKLPRHNSCLDPRPAGDLDGRIWDAECR